MATKVNGRAPLSSAEKMRRLRQKRKKEGLQEFNVFVSKTAVRRLRRMAKKKDTNITTLLEDCLERIATEK